MIRMLLCVACIAACGGQVKSPTFSQFSRLPESVTFVAALDADRLRATPFWKKVGPSIPGLLGRSDRRELDKLRSRCDIDPFRDIHWVVYASENDRIDRGVAIVGVSFDRNKLDRCAAMFESKLAGTGELYAQSAPVEDIAEPPPPEREDEPTGPYRRYGDFWIGWMGPNIAVVAEHEKALPLLRKLIEGTPSKGNPRLEQLRAQVDPNALAWLVGIGSNNSLNDVDPISADWLKSATSLTVSLSLGSTLQLRAAAEQESSGDAASIARYLERRLHDKLEEVAFLDRFKVSAADRTIIAELVLDASALDVGAGMIATQVARNDRYSKEVETTPPAAPEPSDLDGDGLLDDVDRCPNEAEDKDGFQDDDGCPDLDNDGDRVADVHDKCPLQGETPNGYQDDDGCPDEDPRIKQQQEATAKAEREKKASAREQQGNAYFDASVFDKAIEEYRAAYALVPEPKLLYNIAVAYEKQRDPQNAIAHYQKFVDAVPDDKLAGEARKRIAILTKQLKKK